MVVDYKSVDPITKTCTPGRGFIKEEPVYERPDIQWLSFGEVTALIDMSSIAGVTAMYGNMTGCIRRRYTESRVNRLEVSNMYPTRVGWIALVMIGKAPKPQCAPGPPHPQDLLVSSRANCNIENQQTKQIS